MRKRRLTADPEKVRLDLPAVIVPKVQKLASTAPQITMVVFVDISASMMRSVALQQSGSVERLRPLDQALRGLREFHSEVLQNESLCLQLELSIVGFSDRTHIIKPFGRADEWDIEAALEDLPIGSRTRLGEAVVEQFSRLDQHLEDLKARGLGIRGSIIVIITDGGHNGSTSAYEEACRKMAEFEKKQGCRAFGIGVEGADMELLAKLTPEPVELASLKKFDRFWKWLLGTITEVSRTQIGEVVELENPFEGPQNPGGWAKKWKQL